MKKRKFNTQFWGSLLLYGFFMWGFVLFFYGLTLFNAGFHNMDGGQNLRYLNAEYNLSLIDTNSYGNEWSGTDAYITGVKQLMLSIRLIIVSCFFIGVSYGNMRFKIG